MNDTTGAEGSRTGPTVSCDVVVVGAGPAGSAAATVLAEAGRDVVVLERERFPRYCLGESLIPHCWYPLERLGLADRLASTGFVVPKHSVQFVNTAGVRSKPFYFFQHSDHPAMLAWQVVRSHFDELLATNAAEKGARLLFETTATDLLRDDGRVVGVRARTADGTTFEVRAPATIDASGRRAFGQHSNRWREPDGKMRKVALWTYYKGAMRDPGRDEGATTIAYLPEKGWFWYIPQTDDTVSVGIVADPEYLFRETREARAIFEREVETQPWIRDHLAVGTNLHLYQVTHDLSYRSRHCASDGLVLVGDAFSFLDPVFSAGVYLALQSGVLAADAVDAALDAGDVSAARFSPYGVRVCREIEAMRALVFAFYDPDFHFSTFLKAHPDLHHDLTDCLIGNLDRDFTALTAALGQFADLPEPIPYGAPAT
ncbi:MAG: NAD(P)/FAD-dependent oxidoreductase [Planctomycetota bacterium]|nr:NAD(P)/FAD-dependent oxidoreductase [Planctomycetota bacterium]MDP6763255.1 NAD(P)/FAD-dependent oxidoreductase [Planctomycetota bacterium]